LYSDTTYQVFQRALFVLGSAHRHSSTGKKKALLTSQKSFEYDDSIFSSRDLTYLSRFSSGWSWHLTFSLQNASFSRLSRLHRAISLSLSW